MSKRDEAIALGVRALNVGHQARWDLGDALVKFGWKPSHVGESTGGLAVLDEFRQAIADAANLTIEICPSVESFRKYGSAAYAIKLPRLRKQASIMAGDRLYVSRNGALPKAA